MLLFNALTYMSILHLHKSCCLQVYPWGLLSQSGAVVPHREESPVRNSWWPKEKNQVSIVWKCGYEYVRLKGTKAYKNPKKLLWARTEWAEPLHHGCLTNQCWDSEMPHSLQLFISHRGVGWVSSNLSLYAGTNTHSLCELWALKLI